MAPVAAVTQAYTAAMVDHDATPLSYMSRMKRKRAVEASNTQMMVDVTFPPCDGKRVASVKAEVNTPGLLCKQQAIQGVRAVQWK